MINWNQKHPEKKATSIDYDIVTLMLPVVLLGSFLGVQLNIIVPNAVLLILLTVLLIFLSIKTLIKGVKLFRDESKVKERYRALIINEVSENNEGSSPESVELEKVKPSGDLINDDESDCDRSSSEIIEEKSINCSKDVWRDHFPKSSFAQTSNAPLVSKNLKGSFAHAKGASYIDEGASVLIKSLDGSCTRILKTVKKSERTHFQFGKMFPIIILFVVLTLVSFLRESHNQESFVNFERCSIEDWMLLSTFVVIALLITAICIIKLKTTYKQKLRVGYTFTNGDIKWENNIIFSMLFTALVGGILSGMVGLGGGVIFNPLLLEFGVDPQVSSATGMYMVMLATMSSSILFVMEGRMMYGFAIWLGLFMFLATILGIKSVDKAVRKYGRPSLLVLILAGVIIVGTIITPALSISQIRRDYERGENLFMFNSYC